MFSPPSDSIPYRPVAFDSDGATLRGRLYRPAAASASAPCALVIMAPGASATIAMSCDRYAEAFAAHGLAVLLYDHHSIGASDGEPRRVINPWVQARGYRDAVRFARSALPEVDARRIGLWGVSFSGMQVLVLGALLGSELAAVAALVPACGDRPPPADPDGQLFARLRDAFERGDVAGTPQTTFGPMPVVSADPLRQPSMLQPPSAFRWFMEHGGRHGSGWVNDITRVVPETPAPFSPGVAAAHVRVPAQVVYACDDEIARASPAVTRQVCEALGGPKEVIGLPDGCGHFGALWYPGGWFERVSTLQAAFLARQLAAPQDHEAGRAVPPMPAY